MLGLPDAITACLFGLDGGLTQTAAVHARAWKEMFDDFLAPLGDPEFELPRECDEHVDGKPREDGVRAFLAARALAADDGLVTELADRRNEIVLACMRRDGVQPYAGSVRYVEAALAGVEAGRDGGFGYLVGVDRSGQAPALRARGAQVVVCDLADLLEAAR